MLSALLLSVGVSLASPGPDALAPQAPFGPAYCPYTVQFPAQPQSSETAPPDGSKISAAELLVGTARLSAFCSSTPAAGTGPLGEDARKTRVAQLVNALGIANAAVNDVPSSTCSDVEGVLSANGTAYRIVSRLCFQSDSTFIAEAIFGAGADESVAKAFVASVQASAAQSPKPLP